MCLIKKAYHLYFGCKLGDQDNKWALHIVCKSCAIRLGGWINRKGMAMLFAVPMVWSQKVKFCISMLSIKPHSGSKNTCFPRYDSLTH